ncbi:glycosyltransferase [candidate division KSB1 bacterium]|nr:glycosyltransferase [candidate division KSB1 bacterium]
MVQIAWITTILYALTLLIFLFGTFRINKKVQSADYFVSVVVAARNEEKNISHLLSDLLQQTYPRELYELIVVDDQSSDNTAKIVATASLDYPFIRLVTAADDKNGLLTAKKNAIQQGIKESKGDIILSTDADCRLKSTWIETMVSYFTENVGMVVGFSQIGSPGERLSLFEKLQAIDFLALLTAAQGSLNINMPLSATGQNIAYRKCTFEEVGGFKEIGHRISGDDVLLLQLIHRNTNWDIRFASNRGSFNHTNGEKTFRRFVSQRNRWASNGSYQLKLNKLFFLILLNTFTMNASLFVTIPISIFTQQHMPIVLGSLLLKMLIEFMVILRGAHIYGRGDLIRYFPLWSLLEIPYVMLVGMLGNFGKFVWKGRKN